jgi:hypothetical protein
MAEITFDISGKRFGRLIAIMENGRNKDNRVVWECLCDWW